MLKQILRENNYEQTIKQMNLKIFNFLSGIFVVTYIIILFISVSGIRGLTVAIKSRAERLLDREPTVYFYLAVITASIFIYFGLIKIMTMICCKSRNKSTKLRFIRHINMPVCVCCEGLKAYQIVLIYMIPMFLTSVSLVIFCIMTGDMGVMLMSFFFGVIISPDASLLLYIAYLNVKEKPDYISVENHIRGITLYKLYQRQKI